MLMPMEAPTDAEPVLLGREGRVVTGPAERVALLLAGSEPGLPEPVAAGLDCGAVGAALLVVADAGVGADCTTRRARSGTARAVVAAWMAQAADATPRLMVAMASTQATRETPWSLRSGPLLTQYRVRLTASSASGVGLREGQTGNSGGGGR